MSVVGAVMGDFILEGFGWLWERVREEGFREGLDREVDNEFGFTFDIDADAVFGLKAFLDDFKAGIEDCEVSFDFNVLFVEGGGPEEVMTVFEVSRRATRDIFGMLEWSPGAEILAPFLARALVKGMLNSAMANKA